MTKALLTILAAGAVVAACGDGLTDVLPPPDGMTRIYLTDAPFPYDQVDRVDVHIVSIAATTEADTGAGVDERDWVTVVTPDRRFNLLDLQRGTLALLGEIDLSAGTYRAVRVVIDASRSALVSPEGEALPVRWNDPQGDGTGLVTVYAFVEGTLDVPVDGANIVLDFDVGRSFITEGAGPGYLFVPWIRAVNEAVTGSITGVVRGSDGLQEALVPVPRAAITVYDRKACGRNALCTTISVPVASGVTDAQGRYAIRFLPAGRYAVVADPPPSFDAGPGIRDTVAVSAGAEAVADIYLTPGGGTGGQPTGARIEIGADREVALGDSTFFHAAVFTQDGDSVLNQNVTWSSTNSAVASIVSTAGGYAVVHGLALGTAGIIGRSGELADTAMVTVVTAQPPGPVASVEVYPQTVTVAVGDTLFVGATLRDAEGREITDRGVTWSVSPGGVLRTDGTGTRAIFLTAIGPGSATVRAEVEGKSAQATVTVNN